MVINLHRGREAEGSRAPTEGGCAATRRMAWMKSRPTAQAPFARTRDAPQHQDASTREWIHTTSHSRHPPLTRRDQSLHHRPVKSGGEMGALSGVCTRPSLSSTQAVFWDTSGGSVTKPLRLGRKVEVPGARPYRAGDLLTPAGRRPRTLDVRRLHGRGQRLLRRRPLLLHQGSQY
jgi:hypothetical protein